MRDSSSNGHYRDGRPRAPAGARNGTGTPKIIALAGQKGGSGKSTIAVHLCGEFLARNEEVLLVDTDRQGSARRCISKAAARGEVVPTAIVMAEEMHLDGQLNRISGAFDRVVIDCPPGLGEVPRSALLIADLVILPCMPSDFDTGSFADSLPLVREAQQVRKREGRPPLVAVALINRKIPRTTLGKVVREALAKTGIDVLRTELHQRMDYVRAPALGIGVAQYDPKCMATAEVESLVNELLIGDAHGETGRGAHNRSGSSSGALEGPRREGQRQVR